jgi:BirA family transcriptional regulator, biotin operon repressor / biotin---[acetyl-CoA-carboxylase] ligase
MGRTHRGRNTRATQFPVALLKSKLKPFRLHWYPTVGSTNSKAIALRRDKKLFAPACVLTACQTAGRGRGVNVWHAPRGVLTVTFAIPASDQIHPHHIPLVAGLAVRDACAELGAPDVGLKWPNDLWHNDRKLAGLLCERVDGVDLIGVGLNVTLSPDQFPPHLLAKITSLEQIIAIREGEAPAEPGPRRVIQAKARQEPRPPISLSATLLAIAQQLDRMLVRHDRSVQSMLQRYVQHLVLTGRRIRVSDPLDGTNVEGTCEGIDRAGRLLVTSRGQTRAFSTGSVSLA